MTLYDSIIPCFGSRFTVALMPHARQYRVYPLGTFHYFDWQKTDHVGISIGTSPQIVIAETADIGIKINDTTRLLPFSENETLFQNIEQSITPLTTTFDAIDPALPVSARFTFRSCFYPQDMALSCVPGYIIEIALTNPTNTPVTVRPVYDLHRTTEDTHPIDFPEGISHTGIENLHTTMRTHLSHDTVTIASQSQATIYVYQVCHINEETLNIRGNTVKFGYISYYPTVGSALNWLIDHTEQIIERGTTFEQTILQPTYPPEMQLLMSSAFKGLASNAWWAEQNWFSIMEIGAYHSTLDVDYQLNLFFFQYWTDLIANMLNQWADFYQAGSGYMAHDVGQHLEATGNRYGGETSAMKVEENCNYLILLHHYWRSTGDNSIFDGKATLIRELVDFLIASDTSGNGLPNQYADNTNDWGSGLITASEDQSYHGVRMVVALRAVVDLSSLLGDDTLSTRCTTHAELILATLDASWLGDHYPISLSSRESYNHYSMWTTHGLLYALRNGISTGLDLDKLRIDLINSTQHTMHEHGSVHSTVDVRGWLTQNLWRDCIAAYLGIDMTHHLRRYLGHGEYVSYEDTTILEVVNELMVVPGAIAEHTRAGETHEFPMVDGHPRPACIFGLPYALAGIQFDAITKHISFAPVVFPLTIPLTHFADWQAGRIPSITFERHIPNQDSGYQPQTIEFSITHRDLLDGWTVQLREDNISS